MEEIEKLGIVVQPQTQGFAWESKVCFTLPKSYCNYLGIKPNDIVYALIRKSQDGLTTIFINKKRDSELGVRCKVSEYFKIKLNNSLLGITTKDFFEISIIMYDKKRLSIRLKQLKKVPNYAIIEKKYLKGLTNNN